MLFQLLHVVEKLVLLVFTRFMCIKRVVSCVHYLKNLSNFQVAENSALKKGLKVFKPQWRNQSQFVSNAPADATFFKYCERRFTVQPLNWSLMFSCRMDSIPGACGIKAEEFLNHRKLTFSSIPPCHISGYQPRKLNFIWVVCVCSEGGDVRAEIQTEPRRHLHRLDEVSHCHTGTVCGNRMWLTLFVFVCGCVNGCLDFCPVHSGIDPPPPRQMMEWMSSALPAIFCLWNLHSNITIRIQSTLRKRIRATCEKCIWTRVT